MSKGLKKHVNCCPVTQPTQHELLTANTRGQPGYDRVRERFRAQVTIHFSRCPLPVPASA